MRVAILSLTGLMGIAVATAQTTTPFLIQAPHPPLKMPSVEEITGKVCTYSRGQMGYVSQDATNLYWSGKVYAQTRCGDAMREGCALVQWDPTGTAYTILQVIYRVDTEREQRTRQIGASDCLAPESPLVG
jgi:hypothetical protein